jgi:hypothetical protein
LPSPNLCSKVTLTVPEKGTFFTPDTSIVLAGRAPTTHDPACALAAAPPRHPTIAAAAAHRFAVCKVPSSPRNRGSRQSYAGRGHPGVGLVPFLAFVPSPMGSCRSSLDLRGYPNGFHHL